LIEAPALRLPGTGPGRCATLPSARLAPPTALSLQQTWQSFQRLRPARRASVRWPAVTGGPRRDAAISSRAMRAGGPPTPPRERAWAAGRRGPPRGRRGPPRPDPAL